MRPSKILLAELTGPTGQPVDAWPCGVPGLAVTAGVPPVCVAPSWTVTHVRSGGAVWRCVESPEAALHFAQRIAALADWTLPVRDLLADDELGDRLFAAGMHNHTIDPSWPGADLNGAVL